MMGLLMLVIFAVYLLVSVFVVKKAVSSAKASGGKPWLWGGLAAFVMYNLVFWDLIPTLIAHKYYCSTQAGFWAYKTPEQWIDENPGVMETLKDSLSPTRLGVEKPTKEKTWVNQRFYNEIKRSKLLHSLSRTESKFYDGKKNTLIAKSVNFWKGKSGGVFGVGGNFDELRQALIFDWGIRECPNTLIDRFDQYVYQFWKHGEGK